MNNKIEYEKIYPVDYEILTMIMTSAFNEYTLEILFVDPSYKEDNLGTIVWKHIEQKYISAKKWTVETPSYSKRTPHFYTKKCRFTFVRKHIYNNDCRSFIFEKSWCAT